MRHRLGALSRAAVLLVPVLADAGNAGATAAAPATAPAAAARPDAAAALMYVENAILLQKLEASGTVESKNHMAPRAAKHALMRDVPAAIRVADESGRSGRPAHHYDLIVAVTGTYFGHEAAFQAIDAIAAAAATDPAEEKIKYLLAQIESRPSDRPACDRMAGQAMDVARAAAAKVERLGASPNRRAQPRYVAEQLVSAALRAKQLDQARGWVKLHPDAAYRKTQLAGIAAVEAEQRVPRRDSPAASQPANDLAGGLLADLRRDHPAVHAEFEPLVRARNWARAGELAAVQPAAKQRAPMWVVVAAGQIRSGNKSAAGTSFLYAVQNEAMVSNSEAGSVDAAALKWLPVIEGTGDAALVARTYASVAALSRRAAGRSARDALALRQLRVGNLQDAVDWVMSVPDDVDYGDARQVYGALYSGLMGDVIGGRAVARMPPLRTTPVPVATLIEPGAYLGKPTAHWVRQLGEPDPAGDHPPRQAEEAAFALTAIGEPAIPALVEYHKKHCAAKHDPRFMGIAGRALKVQGDDGVRALVQVLAAQPDEQTGPTIEALGQLTLRAVRPVTALLSSPDAGVRRRACLGLRRLAHLGQSALPALRKATQDADPTVRKAAIETLAHMKRRTAPEQ